MSSVKTKYSLRMKNSLYKDAIMLRWAFLHESTAQNVLTMHTPNSRNVTWGKEHSNCRWIHCDFLVELREISGCLASQQIKVQVLLCMQESLNAINKIRLINFRCKVIWITMIVFKS